jgi:hypothetical protein
MMDMLPLGTLLLVSGTSLRTELSEKWTKTLKTRKTPFITVSAILAQNRKNKNLKRDSIRKMVIWRYYTEIGKIFTQNEIVCTTYVNLYMNVNLFSYTRVRVCIGVPKIKSTFIQKLTFINIS